MRPGSEPPAGSAASWRRRLASFVEFRPREATALGVACLALVAGAAFAYARSLPSGGAKPLATPVAEPSPTVTASATGVVVDVAGAVRSPGVYTLPPGARVIDGIRAAGGPAPYADVGSVNLARPLIDGERVYIPRKGETPPPEAGTSGGTGGRSSGSGDGKVNINTATERELEALPGIGQVLAQRIVDYRIQHGPFREIRDLLKVEGIGEKKFDSLKDYVTV
jgi:competence protein ComEA